MVSFLDTHALFSPAGRPAPLHGQLLCHNSLGHTFPIAAVEVAMSSTKGSPLEGAAKEIGLVPRMTYSEKAKLP